MDTDILKDIKNADSLTDVLTGRSRIHPEKMIFSHHHFDHDGAVLETDLTYGELADRSKSIAAGLLESGKPGDIAVLLYPPGLDYIMAFMGCLYAGIIAVPAYPPYTPALFSRFRSIVRDCGATFLLSTSEVIPLVRGHLNDGSGLGDLIWMATDEMKSHGKSADQNSPGAEATAFIQYTSGSTSVPKGVRLTHGNLMDNSRAIHRFFGTSESSRGVFWLPLYHDMGLIGGVLQTLFCGGSSVLFSPLDFLRKPLRWLQAVSRFKATISGGPNFAYDLCARKARPEDLDGLDLSSWALAFNGAEPVRHETLERFHGTFKKCGFRFESLYPCYGLAESTLIVSGPASGKGSSVRSFDKTALKSNRVVAGNGNEKRNLTLVGCGWPMPGNRLLIVNPETQRECTGSEIGEIWVQSPSIAESYVNRPEESHATFQAFLDGGTDGPFLRTGDLGFIHDDELFISGRLKDLIIIRGKNYFPNDIEAVADRSHPSLRPGCCAAFSVDHDDGEVLVIVQEIRKEDTPRETGLIRETIRRAVLTEFKLIVYDVVLIRQNTIPKTSSGKIRRHACKAHYLSGDLKTYDDI